MITKINKSKAGKGMERIEKMLLAYIYHLQFRGKLENFWDEVVEKEEE